MNIECVSCSNEYDSSLMKYTHRNGEYLALCPTCWQAALQIQKMLSVPSRAEAAKERYEMKKMLEGKSQQ